MTFEEIEAWALANGWEKHHCIPSVKGVAPFDVLRIKARYTHPGLWICIQFLQRNLRVWVTDFDQKALRIATSNPRNVIIQGGIPRGIGLWTSACSPYYHRSPV
jgi:hypothetical protein